MPQAVEACRQWAGMAIADKKVVGKPNLVVADGAGTGVTTDLQMVRALVDLSLDAGAAEVLIVESGPRGANASFSACGYEFSTNMTQRDG